MCTCTPGNTCWTHKTEEQRLREDRLASLHAHARIDVDAAARALTQSTPHITGEVLVLEKAAKSLQDYLTELRQS